MIKIETVTERSRDRYRKKQRQKKNLLFVSFPFFFLLDFSFTFFHFSPFFFFFFFFSSIFFSRVLRDSIPRFVRRSVGWSLLGRGPQGVDDLCFHTGEFSPSPPPLGPLTCIPLNFKHNILRQGTGTADHLTLCNYLAFWANCSCPNSVVPSNMALPTHTLLG